jgi:hypothetical protein
MVPVMVQAAQIGELRCEYLKDPPGVDVVKPRLSWNREKC